MPEVDLRNRSDLMEQDTIDLLKELVAIDSQNPSLVPRQRERAGSRATSRTGLRGPGWRLRSWRGR